MSFLGMLKGRRSISDINEMVVKVKYIPSGGFDSPGGCSFMGK